MNRLQFPEFDRRTLDVLFFKDVKNGSEIVDMLKKGKITCALLNPEYIVDWFTLIIAACVVLEAQKSNTLVTRSIHTELVYRLSASKHISSSLKTHGFNPSQSSLICCIFDASPNDLHIIRQLVVGECSTNHNALSTANLGKIVKVKHTNSPPHLPSSPSSALSNSRDGIEYWR
eukprot:TRINITY_DN10493_c0_g1_i2.p1 TRINITY_DN10493_c0_g1~~TRINITY_DN10493_c0_g1_i2.p1  ORF type:complete len:174 (+),score=16.74 TRINITY_DN10493_c0_g1_i2:83-604(+)